MSVPGETDTDENGSSLESLVGGATSASGVLAVLGIVLYAVLRIAYSFFYSPFGLRPDDLGLGYLDLLVQSAVGIVLLCMAMLVVAAVFYAAFSLTKAASKSLTRHIDGRSLDERVPKKKKQDAGTGSPLGDRRIWAALILVVIVAALLMARAYSDRSKVWDGHSASFTVFGFSITSWGAEDATISWTSDVTAAELSPLAGRCLLYFGQSGGTAYFYKRDTRQVLRIPTSDIVIHTRGKTCGG